MRIIENTTHGRPCDKCGKELLYGSKVYKDKSNAYRLKCGNIIKGGKHAKD